MNAFGMIGNRKSEIATFWKTYWFIINYFGFCLFFVFFFFTIHNLNSVKQYRRCVIRYIYITLYNFIHFSCINLITTIEWMWKYIWNVFTNSRNIPLEPSSVLRIFSFCFVLLGRNILHPNLRIAFDFDFVFFLFLNNYFIE